MKNQSGLTFIELTIVILIIGLVLAIASPNFMNLLKSTKTGSASLKLAGYIKYLQDKVARENIEYSIFFDMDLQQYWAAKESPEEEMPPEYWYATEIERIKMRYPPYKDEFIRPVVMPNGVSIALLIDKDEYMHTEGYHRVAFYPDGTADKTTIYLQDDNEAIITIHIKPYTSKVEIFDGYEEIKRLPQLIEED